MKNNEENKNKSSTFFTYGYNEPTKSKYIVYAWFKAVTSFSITNSGFLFCVILKLRILMILKIKKNREERK